MANQGERTREHLLDVAEQCFGADGVANVSLRQIRIAAGQRNEAAMQYHFGDRDGLLRAIAERHTPAVQAIQDRIATANGRRPSMRRLVEAFVRPLPEYGTRGPSERAWIKILAELLANPRLSMATIQKHTPRQANEVGVALYERLATKMPAEVAAERLWAVAQFTIHVCADRARIVDDPATARVLSSDDAFANNLVDMALGALTARVHGDA